VDTLSIARELIGCTLVSISGEGTTAGRIVEAEAYLGKADSAAHAFRGRVDGRTEVLYRQGGYAYVFLIYGMYSCFNVSTGPEGVPECVLIRALEPLEGIELMRSRRGMVKLTDLCSGPGKLCQAMAITKEQNMLDLCGAELYIAAPARKTRLTILRSPRIHIDYAEKGKFFPWRFYIKDNPYVSRR
jgi:DNA-3-methyladenine glycosylase